MVNVRSASFQFSHRRMTTMPTSFTTSATRVMTPEANISWMLSTSPVTRVTSRPTGVLSKNDARRVRMCSWSRTRRSVVASCPTSWSA